jgi:hypothetical protein
MSLREALASAKPSTPPKSRAGPPAASPPSRTAFVPAPAVGVPVAVEGLTAVVLAVLAGAVAVASPLAGVGAVVTAVLVTTIWLRPAIAAYLLIGITPLVAGIDRGVLIPMFRPNEALLLLLAATLTARGLVALRSGGVPVPRPDRIEWSILLLAVTSSVLPLATMTVRAREISGDDLMHAVVLWKLLGVYLVVRFSVRSDDEVRRCLQVSVAAASLVAAIGILQGLGLFGMRELLAAFFTPFGYAGALDVPRGGSTLSLPAATADLMVMNVAVATGLWLRYRRALVPLSVAAALFVGATLAAGEFSSTIGLVLGIVALVVVTDSFALLSLFGLLGALGAVAVWPVIEERLQGFHSASGLPVSWLGRLDNLRGYFWPRLFSDGNYLLGVRPSARVQVGTEGFGWVWIESGYTWLLWGGGIPLLASFMFFVQATASRSWHVARRCHDACGVAGAATFVSVIVITALMLFDPHLTYRGSADEMFALVALTGCAARRVGTAARDPSGSPGARPLAGPPHCTDAPSKE